MPTRRAPIRSMTSSLRSASSNDKTHSGREPPRKLRSGNRSMALAAEPQKRIRSRKATGPMFSVWIRHSQLIRWRTERRKSSNSRPLSSLFTDLAFRAAQKPRNIGLMFDEDDHRHDGKQCCNRKISTHVKCNWDNKARDQSRKRRIAGQ